MRRHVHDATRHVSSGGVIIRQQSGQPQVCVIARRRDRQLVWGLPKGHVEDGEDLLHAAIREVREETGLLGEPLLKLGAIAYQVSLKSLRRRYAKTVHFYLLRYREGTTHAHDREVEEAVWLAIDEAMKRLSYENERRILRKAKRHLA